MAPSKLDVQAVAAIELAVTHGATLKQAAQAAGVNYTTYRDWYLKGEAECGRDPNAKAVTLNGELYKAVERARGRMVTESLRAITEAAENGDWKAAAWKLERILPAQFGFRNGNQDESNKHLVQALEIIEKHLRNVAPEIVKAIRADLAKLTKLESDGPFRGDEAAPAFPEEVTEPKPRPRRRLQVSAG